MIRPPPRSPLFPYATLFRSRPLIAPGETVLGDAVGRFKGPRRWHEAFRLVVATEARLLIVGATRSAEPTVLDDLPRSEENTSELQSRQYLVCRLLLEKKKWN